MKRTLRSTPEAILPTSNFFMQIRTLYLFILFLAGFSVSFAQGLQPVMPGALIVKLKDQKIQAKTINGSPAAAFRSFGVSLEETVWKPEFDQKLSQVKQKRKSANPAGLTLEGLRRTYRAEILDSRDPYEVAAQLSKLPYVEYAEPVYLNSTQALPNDSLVNKGGHAYFDHMGFPQAFDITTGSSDVIIAIVDSGVDYTHPDLDGKLWRNEAEISGNGIDDDNNGFIDDVIGWDFWNSGLTFATIEQDNDPIGSGSDHGTHVAGSAAAETNNGSGIAGTGYNCRYMAIKAGGIPNDPATPADESRSIGFGYDGILYAIQNGADVINNSWSGPSPSLFGRDVIKFASESDVVVVCAASNDGVDQYAYPASFPGAFSVAALGDGPNPNGRTRASFSNYNWAVDVAASGVSILSTVFSSASNIYGVKSGTSMASPIVAGLAGLVRSRFPEMNAEQVVTQIRASSTNIDAVNSSSVAGKLGNGVINAAKAVTSVMPGILLKEYRLTSASGAKPRPGESGTLRVVLKNVGASVTVALSGVAIRRNTTLGQIPASVFIPSGEDVTIDIPVTISAAFSLTTTPAFRINFSSETEGYSDFVIIEITDFAFSAHDNSNIITSFSSDGTMGWQVAEDPNTGVGFSAYMNSLGRFSDNLLYESGLMFSIGSEIFNKARGVGEVADEHFLSKLAHRVGTRSTGNQIGSGTFDFSLKPDAPDVLVTQETFSFADGALKNSIIARYNVKNNTSEMISNLRMGVFSDWDLGEVSGNATGFIAEDTIMYVYEPGNPELPFVATLPYRKVSSLFAINNGFDGTQSRTEFGLYPGNPPNGGFTDQEKNWALSNGLDKTVVEGADISTVSASGPYNIPAGGSIDIAFIHAYGETEQELIAAVRAAKAVNIFELSTNSERDTPTVPIVAGILNAYPNPFNPEATIEFSLTQASAVSFQVFNLAGQRVRDSGNLRLSAGTHTWKLDGKALSSGVYLLKMTTPAGVYTRKITLLK